jgi:hypothetical protein
VTALAADQHPWPRGDTKRFANFLAGGTHKPADPPRPFQISGARILIGKEPLKFGERLRERQIVDVKNIQCVTNAPLTRRGGGVAVREMR